VLILASIMTFGYGLINVFGAWMVIRRKPWVAGLFMVAASLLVIAFAALVFALPYARVLAGAGLIMASVASLLNAYVIIGRVLWSSHAVRAGVALLIFLLIHLALR
jgi:hypothetical protein